MSRNFIVGLLAALLVASGGATQEISRVKITDLEKIIAESRTPLVITFWATFCLPCIEEIPYFHAEIKKHKKDSVRLLLVSLDMEEFYPSRIRTFAVKQKFTAPILWLDESNADYFCPKIDPAWSGAIPATLFVNNGNGYRKFIEDQISEEEFKKNILALKGK
ncbi:MAG TPA: TlpA disulfide reductase family protein [Chitinophagaceae bacterium]|nr:TlpA disulfide reductase family protein [Chitinophagaceae bacterium]